jgi:hypothetical protein
MDADGSIIIPLDEQIKEDGGIIDAFLRTEPGYTIGMTRQALDRLLKISLMLSTVEGNDLEVTIPHEVGDLIDDTAELACEFASAHGFITKFTHEDVTLRIWPGSRPPQVLKAWEENRRKPNGTTVDLKPSKG